MAPKPSGSAVLFLALNLLFFTLTSACSNYRSPPQKPPTPTPCPPSGSGSGSGGGSRGGSSGGSNGGSGSCPVDALKLGVCADVLNGLIHVKLGKPPKLPCCSLLDGLVDLEAAVCLCTVLKGNILGIKLNLPIHLSLLLNYCGKNTPKGFQCP